MDEIARLPIDDDDFISEMTTMPFNGQVYVLAMTSHGRLFAVERLPNDDYFVHEIEPRTAR